MRFAFRLLLLWSVLVLGMIGVSCDCGDDDDDDDDNDDASADDDASPADDDDASPADDDDDDDDSGPPVVDCIPPLDYDGDGNAELLLSVWLTDYNLMRLHLVEPGTFTRGEPILEYDVTGGGASFQAADFDGNGVWDIVAVVEANDGGGSAGWYDVFLNGDFSAPAHTFGPYADTTAIAQLLDIDGNGLPEMMIRIESDGKGTSAPAVWQLIDADHDFSAIATFHTPESAPEGSLVFLPERRVGAIWPVAGSVTGAGKAPELMAYAYYTVSTAHYLKLFVFNAADGALIVESSPYYLGDAAANNYISSGDVDGDGQTEAVVGISKKIDDPENHTAYLYIVGGPELMAEWSGPETDDAYATGIIEGDYNLDGVLDPIVGLNSADGGDNAHQALNGPGGYSTLFQYTDSNAAPLTLLTRTGRGYLDFGFNYRGVGNELFLSGREVDGTDTTGQVRAIETASGDITGVLQEFDLGDGGGFYGTVLDLGGDGTLDFVVRYTERYQNGADWATIVYFEVMTAPNFYEILHAQMPDGYEYYFDTTLDLTGDLAPDLLVMRRNETTYHEDYLLYPCDSTGCDDPVSIDYEADEQFNFIGPML
ncbi:MAG: VCBS repeat-containing protein [Myxococcales bacterium]|nr:VCBS repeat-containing protein [Myxococcales bacterium]